MRSVTWLLARQAVRLPSAWLAAVLAIVLVPASFALAPLGITEPEVFVSSQNGSIWFLCSLVSTIICIITAHRIGPALDAADPLSRSGGIFCAAVAMTCVLALSATGLSRVLDPSASVPVAAGLLCAAHFAALGVWLDRLPLPAMLRCIALALLAWLAPALAGSHPPALAAVSWLLGPAGHAAAQLDTYDQVLIEALPIAAWLVAACLVAPHGTRIT